MMYGNSWTPYMFGGWMGGLGAAFGFLLLPLIIWSLFWKGWALWRAARNGSKWWFVALLIINTAGILEIIYIFFFSGMKKGSSHSRRK